MANRFPINSVLFKENLKEEFTKKSVEIDKIDLSSKSFHNSFSWSHLPFFAGDVGFDKNVCLVRFACDFSST